MAKKKVTPKDEKAETIDRERAAAQAEWEKARDRKR